MEDTERSLGSLLSPPITSGLTPPSSPRGREVMDQGCGYNTYSEGREETASAETLHCQARLTSLPTPDPSRSAENPVRPQWGRSTMYVDVTYILDDFYS